MFHPEPSIPFGRESREQQFVDLARRDLIRSASDSNFTDVQVNPYALIFQRALADLQRAQEHHVVSNLYDHPSRQNLELSRFLDTVSPAITARIGKEPRMYDPMVMRHVTPGDLVPRHLVYYWNESDRDNGDRTLYLACVVNPAGTIVTRLSDGDLYMDTVKVHEDLYICKTQG